MRLMGERRVRVLFAPLAQSLGADEFKLCEVYFRFKRLQHLRCVCVKRAVRMGIARFNYPFWKTEQQPAVLRYSF